MIQLSSKILLCHILLLLFPSCIAMAFNKNPTSQIAKKGSLMEDRRAFIDSFSTATISGIGLGAFAFEQFVWSPDMAFAATDTVTQVVKVTPVSHTFISSTASSKASIKPIRENDATRYFTNARVMHMFYDGDISKAKITMKTILDLTVKRKKGEGAGVTPGDVHFLVDVGDEYDVSEIDGILMLNYGGKDLKDILGSLPDSDVLVLAPKKSSGTVGNGKILEGTAIKCGLEIGGSKSGGVISVLMNGPKDPDPVSVLESGYPTSTILWYDI